MGGNTAFGYLYKYSFFVLYIVNYFDFTKKEIFVKKILGYSLFNRYKNEFIYFIMIYIFGLVQIMILSRSFTSMAIYVLLVLLDILIIFRMIYVKETKQLSTMLKGEE